MREMKFWLITDDKSAEESYSSLSMSWRPASKYHGLLVRNKRVICSGVEERFNHKELEIDGFDGSTFWFHSGDVRGVKTLEFNNGVAINYKLAGEGELEIFPYLNSRSIYTTSRKRFSAEVKEFEGGVRVSMEDNVTINGEKFERNEKWKRLEYIYDRDRGEDWEDLVFIPGRFFVRVDGTRSLSFSISTGAAERSVEREKRVEKKFSTIWRNCDSFILKNGIKAGYYWFDEWGRDSLISLPGLTLVRGEPKKYLEVLDRIANMEKGGLLPNLVSKGEATYNSVDAPLWFIDRVSQLYKGTGSERVFERFSPTIRNILDGYMDGTDFGIKADGDLLIEHDPQVTWMDAVVDGKPVTPRSKAVEVQALWYNGLETASGMFNVLGERKESEDLKEKALKVKRSFNDYFPIADKKTDLTYLKDSLDGGNSIRPNQIFAISLEHPVLRKDLWDKVMRVVIGELLTPFGLRSLSPGDDEFRPRYEGNIGQRDLSYHNGPVWPWLIGPFIDAYLKTYGNDDFASHVLDRLVTEENRACYGYIPELYDGLPPYLPKGAIAQAWSMAEVLRGARLLGLI